VQTGLTSKSCPEQHGVESSSLTMLLWLSIFVEPDFVTLVEEVVAACPCSSRDRAEGQKWRLSAAAWRVIFLVLRSVRCDADEGRESRFRADPFGIVTHCAQLLACNVGAYPCGSRSIGAWMLVIASSSASISASS
jgi:hypothetical protein